MKFFFPVIILISSQLIFSQEFDDTFLKALPDDLRKDVLERADGQDENADDKYSPYLYSSKLEQEEELKRLKNRLEIDLQELEKRLNSDDELQIDDLELFGSNFFNTFQTSFMPINEPNPDSSYSLDIGDIINIQLIGQKTYVEDFPINGDGSINLPDIGQIFLAGLNLDEVSNLIKSKVNQAFIGTEAFVSLSRIRDVNILVTGNAKSPGIYTLTGNSNILHALSAAGGISDQGSYREISLIRKNKIIETLDVYSLLIDGNYNLNKRLRSGDVVFVEPVKNIVTIDGAVKRPAMYELADGQYLDEVVRYANGLKQSADIQNISLERMLDGTLKTIPVVNQSQFKTIKPIDGDLIYVREFAYRQAKIHGAIRKPGSYTLANGETLDDLIQKAGGLNNNAYPFGAIYINEGAKLISKKSKEVLYDEFIDNIIAMSQQNIGQDFDLSPIIGLALEIKKAEPNGRIVVDLLDKNSIDFFQVKEGDELFIPEANNNVFIYGEVSTEGTVMFKQNEDLQYYVDKSGGLKKYADSKSIYILHPNGETQRYSSKRNIFESKPKGNIQIYPGSVIFIPRKLDESTGRRLATQAYVSILGNLGIALASLSSISNNN
jgi:protein involved in polysaccharide export with SLBB domain